MHHNKITRFFLSLLIAHTPLFVNAFFVAPPTGDWYLMLNKPSIMPPGWLFSVVWLTLYTLMGVALYQVWSKKAKQAFTCCALVIFLIQLMFNASWSYVFFSLQDIYGALVVIGTLIVLVLLTIYHFYRISKMAAWLLVPYLIWVCFATWINWQIFLLN